MNRDDWPQEGESRQEYCARMGTQRRKELESMDPLARNIARIDAELGRRLDTMKHSMFTKPEDAAIVRELAQALATLVEMQTMLYDEQPTPEQKRRLEEGL